MSNRKNSSLRFLWIPGRKKHNRKGQYNTTYKTSQTGNHPNKPNEPWALGGSKGHEEIVKDISGETSGVATSTAAGAMSSVIGPASCAAVSTSIAISKDDENPSTDHLNGNIPSPPEQNNLTTPSDVYNAETLIVGSKLNGAIKKAYLTNANDEFWHQKLPSIEHLPSIPSHLNHFDPSLITIPCDFELKHFQNNLDSIDKLEDTVDYNPTVDNLPTIPASLYKKPKDNEPDSTQMDRKSESSEEKDDPTVKCLYYTLMCCECTIS